MLCSTLSTLTRSSIPHCVSWEEVSQHVIARSRLDEVMLFSTGIHHALAQICRPRPHFIESAKPGSHLPFSVSGAHDRARDHHPTLTIALDFTCTITFTSTFVVYLSSFLPLIPHP